MENVLDLVFDMDLEKWSGTANSITTILRLISFPYLPKGLVVLSCVIVCKRFSCSLLCCCVCLFIL